MTEQEVRETMKAHRWSFLCRMRKNHAYVYAARKVNGKREERYVTPLTSLGKLTVDQLEAKLNLNCSAA